MLQTPQSCVDAGNSLTVVAAVSNFYYSRPTELDPKKFNVLFFWLQELGPLPLYIFCSDAT